MRRTIRKLFSLVPLLYVMLLVACGASSQDISISQHSSSPANHASADSWGLSWGGTDSSSLADRASAVAVDNDGNLYVVGAVVEDAAFGCLLYTSPSPRDLSTSRMPSSA